jgi:hypothetical protein
MVVDDLDIAHVAVTPAKANPELVVDPDAELPVTVASQGFQTIPRGRSQEIQGSRSMQLRELPSNHCFNSHETADAVSHEEQSRILAYERNDHGISLIECR